jgi:hypothetical protein
MLPCVGVRAKWSGVHDEQRGARGERGERGESAIGWYFRFDEDCPSPTAIVNGRRWSFPTLTRTSAIDSPHQ